MSSPGSVLEILCEADQVDRVFSCWKEAIQAAFNEMGWQVTEMYRQPLTGGVSLAFVAPIDVLYGASEINEWAYSVIEAEFDGKAAPAFERVKQQIEETLAEEKNPRLLQLQQQAAEHAVTFLWDDDEVSLGLGTSANTWPVKELPKQIDWSRYSNIPIGIVTGTNGKTTTARLSRFILQNAGASVGVSCTDWLAVNDEIIDRGDWSGPGGARTVLRRNDVNSAILETARGGLLRRGLGVERADVAAITNIAADHLGDFGSRNLDELLDIKWIVSRAVEEQGVLVLNADDARLVRKAESYSGKIVWFSLEKENALIEAHLTVGGEAFLLLEDQLVRKVGTQTEVICSVEDVPITLAGAARHNVANVLAAAAMTFEMGMDLGKIADGLQAMTPADNPGRCNLFEKQGVRVLVDFAHNPHAIEALFEMAKALPAERRSLAFGQAGDRPDDLIEAMVESAWSIGLDRIQISELAEYYRGRDAGEVYKLMSSKFGSLGAPADQIQHFDFEVDALTDAIHWAREGDLIIMLALGERDAVHSLLNEQGFVPLT